MNRADPSVGGVASEQNSIGTIRPANSLRLTLASRLGNKIDGAWWPRTGLISRELPDLVSVLDVRLGQVIDINVNWSSLQSQQNLNWGCWQGIHPQIMTIVGRDARATLLVIPHGTGTALAVMVLRQAAGLPVYPMHHDSRAFKAADSIIRVAQGESMFEGRHRASRARTVPDRPATRA